MTRSDPRDAALSPQPGAVCSHHATTAKGDGLKLEKDTSAASNAPRVSGPIIDGPSPSPKRRRRRGKVNAIDELFNGLA